MAPNPVGAVLARDKGTSVGQTHRVIVHREPARLLQGSWVFRNTALSFIAGKRAPTRSRAFVGARLTRESADCATLWERC